MRKWEQPEFKRKNTKKKIDSKRFRDTGSCSFITENQHAMWAVFCVYVWGMMLTIKVQTATAFQGNKLRALQTEKLLRWHYFKIKSWRMCKWGQTERQRKKRKKIDSKRFRNIGSGSTLRIHLLATGTIRQRESWKRRSLVLGVLVLGRIFCLLYCNFH